MVTLQSTVLMYSVGTNKVKSTKSNYPPPPPAALPVPIYVFASH